MRSLPFTKLATGGLTAVLALLLLFVPGALAEDRAVETTADDSAQARISPNSGLLWYS